MNKDTKYDTERKIRNLNGWCESICSKKIWIQLGDITKTQCSSKVYHSFDIDHHIQHITKPILDVIVAKIWNNRHE